MMPVDVWVRRLALGLTTTGMVLSTGAAAMAAEPQYDFTATSSTITILFDGDGTMSHIRTGLNASISGMPVPPIGITDIALPPESSETPQFSVQAKEGIVLDLGPKVPGSSELAGGFTVNYGEAILTGERLNMNQSVFPMTAIAVIEHGAIFGGPAATVKDRVNFDSSQSKLPRFAFRGVVQSAQVHMDRKELAPPVANGTATGAATKPAVATDPPGSPARIAHYHVTMTEVGDFQGSLRSHQGWAYYTGWCDHAEVDLAGEVSPKGLANLRMEQVTLFGSQTPDGHPRRLAEVHRPQQAKSGTAAAPK